MAALTWRTPPTRAEAPPVNRPAALAYIIQPYPQAHVGFRGLTAQSLQSLFPTSLFLTDASQSRDLSPKGSERRRRAAERHLLRVARGQENELIDE